MTDSPQPAAPDHTDGEGPINGFAMSAEPGQRGIDQTDIPVRGVRYDATVHTEVVEGVTQLKLGRSGDFEVYCDEPPTVGGQGRHPTPMDYMAMATGFCLMTQIERYAFMMKLSVSNIRVKVTFRKTLGGSLRQGTVFNEWQAVETHLEMDSDASPEDLEHLIRNAKGGCFAEGLIVQQVPLVSTVEVNGDAFDVDGITAPPVPQG